MSDAATQIQRVLDDSDIPADGTTEQPIEPTTSTERSRQFRYTNFSRMRFSWIGEDRARLDEIQRQADLALRSRFQDALDLLDRIFLCVREPAVDGEGEVRLGPDGRPVWQADEQGHPVEDWSLLGDTQRGNFLFAINTHLYGWEQGAVDLWAEAMYAKVNWEEKFANAFIKLPGNAISGKPTIDDRTQTGHAFSAQERYFAVYCSALSRKADALIRSMTRIGRMLENTMTR